MSAVNFSSTTPAAPSGSVNVAWQHDALGNISANVAAAGGGGGAVASVFGRTGAVVAASGDYTAAQVTNAVSTAGAYADPSWITSLAWAKITGAPAAGVTSVFGRSGVVTAQAGDYTVAQVTGAAASATTITAGAGLTGGGDLSASRTLAVVPATASVLGGVKIGANISVAADGTISVAAPGGGGSQTPWASDIDAAQHSLSNLKNVSFWDQTISGSHGWTLSASGQQFHLNSQDLNADILTAFGNNGNVTLAAGAANLNLQTNGKTRFFIVSGGSVNIGARDSDGAAALNFGTNCYVWADSSFNLNFLSQQDLILGSNVGGVKLQTNNVTRLLINNSGNISLPSLPSANPGAGTKQLWYDPADSNRVKFAA